MNICVTIQQSADNSREFTVGDIAMEYSIGLNIQDMKLITMYIKNLGGGSWLDTATQQGSEGLENNTKQLIKKAQQAVALAKQDLKRIFPVRHKISYWKFLLKNPFKILYAKWLLRSK